MRRPLWILLILFLFPGMTMSHAGEGQVTFSLKDETGKIYTQEDFKGKRLVLFAFTFECPHCRRAMPVIQGLSEKGHAVLGVAYSTSPQELDGKRKKAGLTFPMAIGTKEFRKAFNIRGVPTLFLISLDGTIAERYIGSKGAKRLQEDLRKNSKE